MIGFLTWTRSAVVAVANSIAHFVVLIVIIFLALLVYALARGDGLPRNMVLTLDLREPIADSDPNDGLFAHHVTVMDLLLGMDSAAHDARVKGIVMRLGNGSLSTAQGEEIATAIQRFRASGKFVIAQATAFFSAGMGDYVAASAANEIWMQPKSPFSVSGAGGGEVFLRGLLDKIQAVPQIAKRAEYKSAADMFMEKNMTAPDREQLTELMQSVYDSATSQMAKARHLTTAQVVAALQASPQLAEDALKAHLIDRIGYDDDARGAATGRAGAGVKTIKMTAYIRDRERPTTGANIAIIEASGDIRDGTAQNSLLGQESGIASDDLSHAILQAAADKNIKAIVFRVDSPGGSVTASDQILHAVKSAQKAGKPVVVSMGSVAASGGYYISASANRIVAEPGTITGSIGVLTGKVSIGKTLGLIGVGADEVAVGNNTLMDSMFTPYTPDQWANINHQADVIYEDFMSKVAQGRKLSIDQVREIAKGRVWSGRDATSRGLVNSLGGFWIAAEQAADLGHVPADAVVFRIYPRPTGILAGLSRLMGGVGAQMALLSRIESFVNSPAVEAVIGATQPIYGNDSNSPVSLRAQELPRP